MNLNYKSLKKNVSLSDGNQNEENVKCEKYANVKNRLNIYYHVRNSSGFFKDKSSSKMNLNFIYFSS